MAAWTPEEDAILRRLHATGKSLNAIAQEMSRSKGTISRKAADLGLTWDRAQVKAATEAKVADARARKAALALRALARAEKVYDRLEAEDRFKTLVESGPGVKTAQVLDFVPPEQERALANAAGAHIAAVERLEKMGTSEQDEAKSVLGNLMHGLRAAYQQMQENG